MEISPEQFIHDVMEKSLFRLNQRYYPPKPDAEKSHLWIGVNPPPDTITLSQLHKRLMTALSKYKWIQPESYLAVVEANTEGGYRPHIHLLITSYDKPLEKPNRVITALSTHFNISKNSIDCKPYHKGLLYQEHVDYIDGNKRDSKKDNVELDRREREEFKIPHIIGKLKI